MRVYATLARSAHRAAFSVAGIGLLFGMPAVAQTAGGRVVGKVIDAEKGTPIPGAMVSIVGTTLATSTKVDGRFVLTDVPAGSATIRVAMIGYPPKSVSGILVTEGKVTSQDVSLTAQVAQLEELTVTAQSEQGTVNSALDEQQQSIGIVNAISAEQMSRSPDGDAAAALQRMSGATVQDGRYLNMRGLGDRYTQPARYPATDGQDPTLVRVQGPLSGWIAGSDQAFVRLDRRAQRPDETAQPRQRILRGPRGYGLSEGSRFQPGQACGAITVRTVGRRAVAHSAELR